MLGKTLGHYKILGKLGSGGMGDVYRALDTKLGRELAIKVLPTHLAQDPDRRSRFIREAQAVAKLKHPNIITIHSVEEFDDVNFLTMEYVEGETLAALIPRDGLEAERFFSNAIALADAVSAAHEEGITHRDLKPANIMFDKGGRLKVLDFGLAKLLGDNTASPGDVTVLQSDHTVAGQILGTAAYMSPEQAEGKPIDHRSDIFSLGVLLYEMASGRRPFAGDTQISTITSVLRDTPPLVTEIRQNMPRHLGRIINRCLEKDPDRRYQTAKDVRNELEGLKKEVDSGVISQTATSMSFAQPPSAAVKKSKPWLPWAMGAVAVVVVAGSIWGFRQSGSPAPAETQTKSVASVEQTPSPLVSDVADDRKMVVVLPFENLGPPEEAYFAAGMTEEITSRLAAVSGLGIISRTSATQYDRTGKTIGQIADDLGVDFVVEGTVRWAQSADGIGRVRITPQLIRAADDTHLWSETFDRQMDDIFEVQTEIASRVIDQLGVTLLGNERETLAQAPTQNMAAYQLYLQTQDMNTSSWDEYDRRRVALLDEAVRLDPEFLQAWSRLSQHHAFWYNNGLDKTEERLGRARAAMQQAEAIDPDHSQTHLTRGVYFYFGFRDYDQALEEFLAASRLTPNDVQAMEMISYIFRRQGKLEEHLDRLQAAFALDPQNANIARNLAMSYRAQRRFEKAVAMYDRAIELSPNYEYRSSKSMAMLAWKGDLAAAREILQEKPTENVPFYHFGWMVVHFFSREFPEAVAQARLVDDGTPVMHAVSTDIIASIEARFGISDPDSPSLEEVGQQYEALLEAMPTNDGARAALAQNLALRGQFDAAVREAKLGVDLAAKDVFSGPQRLEDLAKVYMWAGRHDEAIDLLDRLLKTVYENSITTEILKLNPDWDPLRENPRFKELLVPGNI